MLKPRLIENIWTLVPEENEAYLSTPWESYRLGGESAVLALRVRSHCTGHNDVSVIAERSGLSEVVVREVIDKLATVGVLAGDVDKPVDPDRVRQGLVTACQLWGNELARGYIGNQFTKGELSRDALVGWLVEMYHYIKDFPEAIRYAQQRCTNHNRSLRELLYEYARQETGHEVFVLRTLEGLGLHADEVVNSTPLVSTRAIGLVMRRLVELDPAAMLLIAALVEAQDFDPTAINQFSDALYTHYGIAPKVFEPYFKHQEIDVSLGHAQLLEENLDLIDVTDRARLDRIVNELHDLKHAFDLQALEIVDYYGTLRGKYFPRQPMAFAAIEPRRPLAHQLA